MQSAMANKDRRWQDIEAKLDRRVEMKDKYVICIVSWIAMSVAKAIVGSPG